MPIPELPPGMEAAHIIGQPRVGQWFFTVQILCPCGAASLLVGMVGSKAGCRNPECGRVYTLTGMPTINDAGNVSVPLGMGIPVARVGGPPPPPSA